MRSDTLIKTFNAPTAVEGYLLVKPGSADGDVAKAGAASDALIGVTTQIGTQDNGSCDVIMAGVTEVAAGGAVSRGNAVVANASGQAVAVTTAGGNHAGTALTEAAEAGDIISILLAPGVTPDTSGG